MRYCLFGVSPVNYSDSAAKPGDSRPSLFSGKLDISPDTRYVLNDPTCGYVVPDQKHEEMTNDASIAQDPDITQMNRSTELKSPNISNIIHPIDSSTPITDSALFNLESKTPQSSSRKPVKNYDVDTKRKPRYICNFCQYGTENYKTIHNHMYRHERVKFRCPYCGFKRAPRWVFHLHE